jgi:hypothetical protein
MPTEERPQSASSPSGAPSSARHQEPICDPPSAEPPDAKIPPGELEILKAQLAADKAAAALARSRANSAAENLLAAAKATYDLEKRRHKAAEDEAGYARDAARDAAKLKFLTDKRDATKPDCTVPVEVVRLLEEQRCEANHKAELAYWMAIHKAALDLAAAEATWAAAQKANEQAKAIADKNLALDETKANVKYYQAFIKLVKK